MSRGRQLERQVERELIAGLGRERRRALVERLRGNAGARRTWDRAAAALRVLEARPVSRAEIDQVERWLFEDLEDQGQLAGEARGASRRRWLRPVIAALSTVAVSAAAVAVIVGPAGLGDRSANRSDNRSADRSEAGSDPSVSAGGVAAIVTQGELQARGGLVWPRPLAIDLACGQPSRPASQRGCGEDELLGFSARLSASKDRADADLRDQALSLFGVDERGELLYYAPNPGGEPSLELVADPGQARWRALPLSIRLDVNHRPGTLRVFAIATPDPVAPADVERWAEALREAEPASVDDPPWHLRLRADELGPVCAGPRSRCASAETLLHITPSE
ncbi:hypothetical protein G6O69_38135 [Pseudenhygromyxa sp. WMMC2535]|uniref:hypothetical protein n=1 Tax=Pseudenhygromyxa sp. WMMC2535 TaxID=2712867 RepID=UPI00155763D9|nr:hypothetical protein [Pseudenhygromyxa sp. WMMC2535]NVB41379.1 hypothetical protein [Pseudenhygromyxa sp. WMMC2535]NVB43688.1 hypothetical protein [Pseudenhygromyxa sp. WMMC2535]